MEKTHQEKNEHESRKTLEDADKARGPSSGKPLYYNCCNGQIGNPVYQGVSTSMFVDMQAFALANLGRSAGDMARFEVRSDEELEKATREIGRELYNTIQGAVRKILNGDLPEKIPFKELHSNKHLKRLVRFDCWVGGHTAPFILEATTGLGFRGNYTSVGLRLEDFPGGVEYGIQALPILVMDDEVYSKIWANKAAYFRQEATGIVLAFKRRYIVLLFDLDPHEPDTAHLLKRGNQHDLALELRAAFPGKWITHDEARRHLEFRTQRTLSRDIVYYALHEASRAEVRQRGRRKKEWHIQAPELCFDSADYEE